MPRPTIMPSLMKSSAAWAALNLARSALIWTSFRFLLGFAIGVGPAFNIRLPPARDRERAIGHVLGDDAAGAGVSARADGDRRHQRGVRADEGVRADGGAVLAEAVIIAGDGAGADIGPRADVGVADISSNGSPWRLGPKLAFFTSTKLPILTLSASFAPGRKRANGPMLGLRADFGALEMAVRVDVRALADLARRARKTRWARSRRRARFRCRRRKYTVAGSISVTPASIAALRARCWNAASASASSTREFTPSASDSSPITISVGAPWARPSATMSVR